MPKLPGVIPVTDLRQDTAAAPRKVRSSRQPLVITQRGRVTAVMLSIEAGRGHDLEAVLREADALLVQESQ